MQFLIDIIGFKAGKVLRHLVFSVEPISAGLIFASLLGTALAHKSSSDAAWDNEQLLLQQEEDAKAARTEVKNRRETEAQRKKRIAARSAKSSQQSKARAEASPKGGTLLTSYQQPQQTGTLLGGSTPQYKTLLGM